jgi:hypothetical protein
MVFILIKQLHTMNYYHEIPRGNSVRCTLGHAMFALAQDLLASSLAPLDLQPIIWDSSIGSYPLLSSSGPQSAAKRKGGTDMDLQVDMGMDLSDESCRAWIWTWTLTIDLHMNVDLHIDIGSCSCKLANGMDSHGSCNAWTWTWTCTSTEGIWTWI